MIYNLYVNVHVKFDVDMSNESFVNDDNNENVKETELENRRVGIRNKQWITTSPMDRLNIYWIMF